MAEVREQAMTHSIERLGKQFLLSEREMKSSSCTPGPYAKQHRGDALHIEDDRTCPHPTHLRENEPPFSSGHLGLPERLRRVAPRPDPKDTTGQHPEGRPRWRGFSPDPEKEPERKTALFKRGHEGTRTVQEGSERKPWSGRRGHQPSCSQPARTQRAFRDGRCDPPPR